MYLTIFLDTLWLAASKYGANAKIHGLNPDVDGDVEPHSASLRQGGTDGDFLGPYR